MSFLGKGYARGGEHLAGFREKREDNAMWKRVGSSRGGRGGKHVYDENGNGF